MVLRVLCIAGVSVLAVGCANRGGKIPYDPVDFTAPSFVSEGALNTDLPLGAFDQVMITFFKIPDLSGEYQVSADGRLDMPLIGTIEVLNRTPHELAGLLEQRYGERYLSNPQVTVRPTQSNQRLYTVEGGVNLPGVFPVNGKTTLLTAIAASRGINGEFGNPRRVAIFRQIEGKSMAAAFDLVAIRRGEMANPSVYPGDIVVVDSNNLRALYRDVLSTLPLLGLFRPFG